MFSNTEPTTKNEDVTTATDVDNKKETKTKSTYQLYNDNKPDLYNSVTSTNIDEILENEKKHNVKESWNKLDNTIKKTKLHIYSDKYGLDNSLTDKEVKQLKTFFTESLRKNKIQKTKDVNYDKDNGIILDVPSLHFNQINRNFTLKITDTKRVSTLKSLTPKRTSTKVKPRINDKIETEH
jgi:hypothetical protein